jgi:guanylate kinase
MSKALKEIKHYDEYDYVLINDNLDNTFQKIVKIIEAERLKLSKQHYLSDFVKKLNLT